MSEQVIERDHKADAERMALGMAYDPYTQRWHPLIYCEHAYATQAHHPVRRFTAVGHHKAGFIDRIEAYAYVAQRCASVLAQTHVMPVVLEHVVEWAKTDADPIDVALLPICDHPSHGDEKGCKSPTCGRFKWRDECEEASPLSRGLYIPCGAPTSTLVKHRGRREGPYFMCTLCASHNVRNRDAVVVMEKPS